MLLFPNKSECRLVGWLMFKGFLKSARPNENCFDSVSDSDVVFVKSVNFGGSTPMLALKRDRSNDIECLISDANDVVRSADYRIAGELSRSCCLWFSSKFVFRLGLMLHTADSSFTSRIIFGWSRLRVDSRAIVSSLISCWADLLFSSAISYRCLNRDTADSLLWAKSIGCSVDIS